MRAEAEIAYSERLLKIADQRKNLSIKVGILGKEVECFKSDCRQKAKAAAELAENV